MPGDLAIVGMVSLGGSLLLTAGAAYCCLPLWRGEERSRTVLSFLLFLRSRRRFAIGMLIGLTISFLLAALVGTVDDLLSIPAPVADASVDVAFLAGSICLFLMAWVGLREVPLSQEERDALRSTHFTMYRFLDDLSGATPEDWTVSSEHPLVPPAPAGSGGERAADATPP